MKTQKTGGRQKGTPNRITMEIRSVLKDVIFNELETLPKRLDKLDDTQRIDVLLKLAPYVLPKLEQARYDDGDPVTWHNWTS